MVLYKNHEKNVVYYNAMIASTKNYEFSKKKMEELKSQVTREVYRNLKTWSGKERLKTQLEAIREEIYVGPESNLETMQEEIPKQTREYRQTAGRNKKSVYRKEKN